jgi:hypothetical protein
LILLLLFFVIFYFHIFTLVHSHRMRINKLVRYFSFFSFVPVRYMYVVWIALFFCICVLIFFFVYFFSCLFHFASRLRRKKKQIKTGDAYDIGISFLENTNLFFLFDLQIKRMIHSLFIINASG